MQSTGIDGCRAGWFVVSIYDDGKWEARICKDVEELWEGFAASDSILIDIPIGLRERGPQERLCDLEARRLLGKRGSSVFRVPCWPATYCDTYPQANQMNKELTGKGLSKQTWGIVPKINEVDSFLINNISARDKLRESHPEVCFAALSGSPMEYSKKERAGEAERLRVLRKEFRHTDELIEYALSKYKRKELLPDDIIDALCLAVSGMGGLENGFSVIPREPEKDQVGLDMQMVYGGRGR